MGLSIGEISALAGVSIRTLRYYDEIGLLKPSALSGAGYRFYDEAGIARLQQILFYRELDFSLRDIQAILAAPDFDRAACMREHRRLLLLKRQRLDELISLTERELEGAGTMDIQQFNTRDIDQTRAAYAAEAEAKWGKTDAYKESGKRTKGYTKEDWANANEEMDQLIQSFSRLLDRDPASDALQTLVAQWQQHITGRYYTCTKEILAGLGEMYSMDERFTKYLDRFGDGTAQLMTEAIRIYCAK